MKYFFTVLFISISAIASATNYYVSPSGNNSNTGTLSNPFRTISYGSSKLRPGDILYVRKGIYREKVNISATISGNENSPIVIKAYPGELPIIDGTGIDVGSGSALVMIWSSYLHFIGFDIVSSGDSGIIIRGSYCLLNQCNVHECWATGIGAYGSYEIVEYCTIYNCSLGNSDGIQQEGETWGAGLSSRGSGGNEIRSYNIIRHNIIHDVWGEGLSAVFCDHATIEDNIVYDTYSALLYTRNCQNTLVQRNLVYMSKYKGWADLAGTIPSRPVGLNHYNEGTDAFVNKNNTLINNIVFGCGRNFYNASPMIGCLVANNTFVNAVYESNSTLKWNVQVTGGTYSGGTFANNIIIQEDETPCIVSRAEADVTFSHNLYNKTYDDNAVGTGDVVGDPKLSKIGETAAGKLTADYFKLLSTSPAINKGVVITKVTDDIFGNKRDAYPDIGANEYYAVDPSIKVNGVTVSGAGGAITINTDNGTLQLSAAVLPANATNKAVMWSLMNGTGQATISASGLVTAVANGTVTAKAAAKDGSGIYGTLTLTISNQAISVTGITVTAAGGATAIATDNGTLQLSAAVLPANATNKAVTWSLTNGTGQATISASGLVTAVANGTVKAKAAAKDGSGIYGTLTLTISNQAISVTGITVTAAGGATAIATDNGTLQLSAAVLPAIATNKAVTWSLTNGTGRGAISAAGLVTAVASGTVTAKATAKDGSGIYGTLTLTISNQTIAVTGITVMGAGGATTITMDNGTLQLSAAVSPANATNKAVTWSLTNGTGQGTISAAGLVTAVTNGTVTAMATAKDGSEIYGTLALTLSNQQIPVLGIRVTGTGGTTSITTDKGTLPLSATVLPVNATNKAVTWSLTNGTGQATISASGLVTAVANGTVTARATAKDGSGIYGTLILTVSNQVVAVTGITVTAAGGATTITTDNGTLQLSASVSPANATNKAVTWALTNSTGQGTISAAGLVTAVASGTVTAKATAKDGSGVVGALIITISNQIIPIIGITVTGAGGASSIFSDNGTLQLSAAILPANASNKEVTWSLTNGTGQAAISTTGLVTAVASGTVTARATAKDYSGVYGTLTITILNQVVPVTSIRVTGAGGATTIAADGGTLQLSAALVPANADNKTVTWSITSGSDLALLNSSTGLLTATDNGSVTARATANDGSGVYGTLTITISGQVIPVTSITVTGAGGATAIAADGGTLQLSAALLPVNATNKTVTWSITNGSGRASINSTTGLVTATDNGSITARGTASDGSGVYGSLVIEISNQLIPVVPVYLNSVIQNSTASILEMIYDVSLANVIPDVTAFKVEVNSVARSVNKVTISGVKVMLTLAAPVIYADLVTVAYTKPVIAPIQTTSGGEALTLSAQTVSNNVSIVNTPPVVVVNFSPESYSGFVNEINATGSYDVNKDILTYTWTVPANIPVSSKSGPAIKYLGPIVNTSQKVEFTLKISDGKTTQSRIIPIEILPFKPELEMAEISAIEASSYQSPYYPYNIIDGNISTMWSANGDKQWLILELKQPFNVQHLKLAFQPGQNKESYFDVFGSEDKVLWEPILTKSSSCAFSGDLQVFEFPPSKAVKDFNFVKLIGLGNSTDTWNHISELKIFGYPHRNSPEYEKLAVKIYPNPAKDHVTFRIDEPSLSPDFIQVTDLSGTVIYTSELAPDLREFTIPINFNKGIYIVQLTSGNLTLFTQKLVVK